MIKHSKLGSCKPITMTVQWQIDLGHKLNKADSETESCKGYGADGYRIGNKYGIGLWDKSKNTRTKGKMRTWWYTWSSDYHLMEMRVLIFRPVQDKQRFVRRATHWSGFRSQRPKPCNLSTTSPLVINRVTIRLTSPRRLIPTASRRTQARTR